jgi:adenine-specific DNA-methyltransferase
VSSCETRVSHLFTYTEEPHQFSDSEVAALITAIDEVKILDPACGSGAFPMGVLHKLVYILGKLDPDNNRWKQTQLAKLDSAPMREELERAFADNNDDYGRKLYLIENCLYGVDIQPIAIQITKLRFFISLVCDQKTNRNKKDNHGIRPLPNLETKFVAVDTLIGLPEMTQSLLVNPRIAQIEKEIESLYHSHFSEKNRTRKLANQCKIKTLRQEMATLLAESLISPAKAKHLAEWDPFDPQSSADFFDPYWMFGIHAGKTIRPSGYTLTGGFSAVLDDKLTLQVTAESGFDIVIGNPPYIQIQKFPKEQKEKWVAQNFATYEATGDIYCLFYERGTQLLRTGGHLCFITSNKWMRAGYGEPLRDFLATKVNRTAVLDFGMAQNFGAATTCTCITSLLKQPSARRTLCCYASDTAAAMSNPAEYFARHAVPLTALANDPWVVLSPERYAIKAQVEAQGVPLEQWKIQIYRAVLTGFNDAFYLTQEQRDAFVAEDPSCAKHLVPLLRGRFVERYATSWDGTWMIATFPAYKLKFSQLPAPIRKHLESYRTNLEPKPRGWTEAKWDGRKAGAYEWFETQDVIAYYKEFTKPKIIYPNMTKYLPFYFDRDDKFSATKSASSSPVKLSPYPASSPF